MQKLNKIQNEVLKKIMPTPADREKLTQLANKLQRKVALACQEQGISATIRIEGSVSKDTWLNEEPEIDVFMRLPTTISRRTLGEISLKIARKATFGAKQVERFAEHPYLEAFIDNVRINIVPSYDVKQGQWISATDRTPFHTNYIKRHLNKVSRNEVRLLKKFLKGIDVYGAELKIGGLSGYLCELLIVKYQSFVKTLRAFASYKQFSTIDIEGYYEGAETELKRLFPELLVIVDPVDKERNVASAVQPQKLYTLVAAARAYLELPSKEFFYPPKITALTIKALKNKLNTHGTSLLFLPLGNIEIVPDVLWGQLYKTQRALRKLAELNDFKVLRDAVWSNEKTLSVFTFELEQDVLPSVKKHLGPPLRREKECRSFLLKYASNACVVSGPYIEFGRWVVELQRKFTDIVKLLNEKVSDGGRNIGVAELVAQAFRENFEILVNSEVVKLYQRDRNFAEFLTGFLSGKPFWLRTAEAQCEQQYADEPTVER